MIQTATLLSSTIALPNLKSGSPRLRTPPGKNDPGHDRRELESALERLSPEQRERFLKALVSEILHRHADFIAGVWRYRRHPYRRTEPRYPVLWSQGTTRLLDCRFEAKDGPPVLIVPSLINRSYILDLTPKNSLVRGLDKRGIAPFTIDWDAPGPEESQFDLTGYILRRLEPALEAVHRAVGRRVTLLGYCMGGLLTVAAAMRRPELINGLVLLASPWDFHQGAATPRAFLQSLWEVLHPVIEAQGQLPVDVLQALFATFDPDLTIRKFTAFGTLPKNVAAARDFVVLEDWANDGVPLTEKVAVECLGGWYLRNTPCKGEWRVDGQVVRPETVACPSLLVIPERDRIVTPASALALSHCLPRSTVLQVSGGHVGMLLSKSAGSRLHAPISAVIKKWAGGEP